MKSKIVASELLFESLNRHDIHLSLLVADTGLWVNAEFHNRLVRDTGSAAMFPKVRRARIGQGERRAFTDEVRRIFCGIIALSGCITHGRQVVSAQVTLPQRVEEQDA